jgi:hypothetical protein
MFRCLRLVSLFGVLCIAPSVATAGEDGFKPIFDGKSLAGWDGNPKLWRVEDGAITGETTAENPAKGNTFLIWREGQPADFELVAEFRMPNPGFANSGIQYRSREEPGNKWVVGGYQADMDGDNEYTGILYEERGRAIVAGRGEKVVVGEDHKPQVVGKIGDPAKLAEKIKKNGWNQYRVIARGNHLQQIINGQLMCDITDNDAQKRRLRGIIALQLHAGPPMKVQFRNIRLKELPPPANRMKSDAGKTKIVFVAGAPSHGYAAHEYYAACRLLANCLQSGLPNVETVVQRNGWPTDAKIFDGADAIVIFSDGGGGNPMLPHLEQIDKLMKQGVGLACIHYSVDVPKAQAGDRMKDWIGGYFEQFWSVNPFWTARFKQLPDHPIARGVKPFSIEDEWYYQMRFADNLEGVTPILTAVPPDSSRQGPDGPYSGNATVRGRKGMAEHLAWARVRPDGGRGFGFTGGHWHWNWANNGYRTIVLNGIAWVAKLDIPPGGVPSKTPTLEELEANQDKPQPAGFDRQKVRKMIEQWK